MLDIDKAQQGSDLFELCVYGVVGIEDELSGKMLYILGELSVFINRGVIIQTVLHADFVVFLAVARGDMDASRARIQGDKGGQDQERSPGR